jgi:predicted GNAT family N-acyltransferase
MGDFRYEFIDGEDGLEAARGVRRQVFIEEQGVPEEIELDGFDGEALHMLVSDAGIAIGTARVRFPEAGTAKIERMAVLAGYRRGGTGRDIISFIESELKRRNIGEIVLHAQYEVADFYRSCGFIETGSPFMEAGIKHIEMRKNL